MEFGEQAHEGGHLFTDRVETVADGEEVRVLEVCGDGGFMSRVLLEHSTVHLTARVQCEVTNGALDAALLIEGAQRDIAIELRDEVPDLRQQLGWRSDPVSAGGFIREHFSSAGIQRGEFLEVQVQDHTTLVFRRCSYIRICRRYCISSAKGVPAFL